ncbi:MAG TPA: hypothetical protein V6D22_14435 [Candidatus Obscuribacterales bacterium]
MEKLKSNRWLMVAIPMVSGFFLCSQPAHAQYVNPNQVYGSVNQQMSQGVLSPGQAQDLMNRENNYAARAARLMRNDGGVLTPNDANKLAREAAKDARQDQMDLGNNAYGGGGIGGILGNLFGGSSTPLGTPLMTPLATPFSNPYVSSPYLNNVAPVYNTPVYNTPMYTPYTNTGYVNNSAAWAAHRAAERARHQQWELRHGY